LTFLWFYFDFLWFYFVLPLPLVFGLFCFGALIELKIIFPKSWCVFLASQKFKKIMMNIDTVQAYPNSILSPVREVRLFKRQIELAFISYLFKALWNWFQIFEVEMEWTLKCTQFRHCQYNEKAKFNSTLENALWSPSTS